jgi:hypothetical protein
MKEQLLKLTLSILTVFGFVIDSNAQCPNIICPSNITSCDAVVSYTTPVGTDTCQSTTLQTDTFNFTGNVQKFVVPNGVDTITASVWGAQGGANWVNNTNFGGFVKADIPVNAGDTLYIYVGEQPNGITGGWNGGGNGETAGKGGGGASDIRIGGTTYNDRILVAGGGGGAGYWSSTHVVGGYGGGYNGGYGYRGTPSTFGGDPGTQTSSGNGTCVSFNNPSVTGGFGFGGSPSGCGCEGYGGGGGWYGGAGSGNCRGGGGGSGYILPTLQNISIDSGIQVGHGQIILTYGTTPAPTTSQIAGLPSGSSFPVGVTTNVFLVSNGTQSDTCSFTVTVVSLDTSVTRNLSTFTANETGATYQWLNCDSNFMAISGATNQSYTATTNGSYAVVVSKNGCTDTSACQMINNVGITIVGFGNISIYPNPTNGLFTIDMGSYDEAVNYTVTSIDGRIVTQKSNVTDNKITIDLGNESKGVYLLKLHNHKSSSVFRITKL